MLQGVFFSRSTLEVDNLVYYMVLCLSAQVVVYVVFKAVVAYTKVSLVVLLHNQGADRDSALFLVGVVIQLGSFLGALLLFSLVYFTDLFSS